VPIRVDSATPSAEMNSVEITFAIAVIPSSQVVSTVFGR
jgi:hypothetical protein